MLKMKLRIRNQWNQVRTLMKTRQDNDVTDWVYIKIGKELSRYLWLGAVCDGNQIGQQRDRSRSGADCDENQIG